MRTRDKRDYLVKQFLFKYLCREKGEFLPLSTNFAKDVLVGLVACSEGAAVFLKRAHKANLNAQHY